MSAVLPGMKARNTGCILAIGARTAVEPVTTLGAYSASKAALVSLVRTIAAENKKFGITANIILPGTMDTPANRAAMPSANFSTWVLPRNVADILVHLVMNRAITGARIPVYGREA